MAWFDRILPLVKLFDWILPVRGMSLVVVGRKPTRRAAPLAGTTLAVVGDAVGSHADRTGELS